MKLYNDLVKLLNIPSEFLTRYSSAMREKFGEAARKFEAGVSTDEGISQCLHLASSVVLRQKPADLENALAETAKVIEREKELKGRAPDTVLTIATVYFLLGREFNEVEHRSGDVKLFRQVQKKFDEKDWLIGRDAMRALGIVAVS